jgi:hypothetical protein
LALPDVQSHREVLEMSTELLHDALRILAEAGFKPSVEQGRHYKVRWRNHTGQRRCIVVARSTSDWRARHNNRANLRRMLSENPS